MPLYQYELKEEGAEGCVFCRNGFDWKQSIHDAPLLSCPYCGKPVRKCIGMVNTPKWNKKPSVIDAKKAGFHILKRRDKGVYEKL